ncbi:TetR/AcrR family transcriptional regulator [Holdemania massiliensis]|uniref:TetR/AcrR family transcriptional regulator n=1 Tax=Holdemania massiliensis TaxID=1468449 RepID=UPI0036F33F8D
MNERNAQLKKSRMNRYFIDAVISLADTLPVDAITLRQVADAAGYNSATLYNYFQNMNQLIAFTLIDRMSRIWVEASQLQTKCDSSLYHYLGQWLAQCRESFQHPRLFLYFFQMEDKTKIYQCISDYFAVFPEIQEQLNPKLSAQIQETDFIKKNQNILLPCVEDGYFRAEDVDSLIAAADILFGGILLQILRHRNDPATPIHYTQVFFRFLHSFTDAYLQKQSPESEQFYNQVERWNTRLPK